MVPLLVAQQRWATSAGCLLVFTVLCPTFAHELQGEEESLRRPGID